MQLRVADEGDHEEVNIANEAEGSEYDAMDEGSYVTSAEMIERESHYSYQSSVEMELLLDDQLEMELLLDNQTATSNADEVIEVEQFELRADPEGADDQ